ncbi:Gibberellin-regulated protein 12 [Arabidopsis thaliana]|uniref:Gibberellin-regulated protein 12 n=2 Tax=Arabidopsis TaxID=3701 RepID=GASAC_ARATH|nr:Gibberellin-regulated family protein [Arabidopsis thaliana]Q6GKX7.1 RecName: Full=Gibberellin-regulated protein 12; AltName: Full=GAST1 protein homolog 12; Flags: Precursor [Arabidopsis thaliana]KAG7638014.1 Gibberellin regulated protein [Arabidopsis thaliana x Arabidopsis arenosa]AAT47788.1 At2g30810 [Arabidopsis thaliana]AAU05509.1 At2g30810 [Arabidopsis thaliana]AEC08443.1 Gibberellin-regulated family protein [Arabidopsis thaliana]|eukprot:NP_180639.2 Gibberellin-regulated family protein [Arabidopsis thaliana]
MMKLIVVFVISSLLFATQFSNGDELESQAQAPAIHKNGGEGSLKPEECPKACEYRCSATSHRKPCLFFCNKCCNKCLCVPSGTYGHKEECPCYNNWTTKEGGPKCP